MTLRNLACSTASLLRLYRTALFQETSDIFSFLGNHVRYSRAAISTLPVDFRAQNVMEVSPTDTVTNNTSQHHLLAEVGVVGVPNAGKSTLTNCLVGKKVTAVSEKTNTTTRSRMGAFTVHNKQVILYDTPGVVGPEYVVLCNINIAYFLSAYIRHIIPFHCKVRCRHYKNAKHAERVQSAWKTAFNCDIILFLIDAARQLQQPDPRVLRLVSNFGSQRAHDDSSNNDDSGNRSNSSRSIPSAILVLNKLDAIPKENRPSVLALTDQFRELASFEEVFWISALRCMSHVGWLIGPFFLVFSSFYRIYFVCESIVN